MTLAEKVAALKQPAAYPDGVQAVQAIETHHSWVFLTERHAFKLKKPMRTSHFDWSTIAARYAACTNEVSLNQRLAPDVYLAAVPLACRPDGSFHVAGEGASIDWLIQMRRLPRESMLDAAIAADRVSTAALQNVGERLARFYAAQPRKYCSPDSYVRDLARKIRADERELSLVEPQLPATMIESLMVRQRAALDALQCELGQRANANRIVEAHGDLRPEHICLIDPPCIIDALDFSSELRTLDTAEELAFLQVECAQLGAAWVGDVVLQSYCSVSGDQPSRALLEFYCSRRATVRAKLMAWRVRDSAVHCAVKWSARAEQYLHAADRHAERALQTGGHVSAS